MTTENNPPALGPTRSEFDAIARRLDAAEKRLGELEGLAAIVKGAIPAAAPAAPKKGSWLDRFNVGKGA